MAVAWPTVRARLVTLLASLDGFALATDPDALATDALVFDGPMLSGDDPVAWVTVGWQDSTDDDSAGSYEQSRTGPDGFLAEESGVVLMEFGAVTGGTAMPDAFALVDALQDAVQADRRLGVLSQAATTSLSVDVVQAQSTSGAVQRLLVSLSYRTHVS